jgi:hypothetical protein
MMYNLHDQPCVTTMYYNYVLSQSMFYQYVLIPCATMSCRWYVLVCAAMCCQAMCWCVPPCAVKTMC